MKYACDTNGLVDVLRDPAAEAAFAAFLARFSHVTFLSAVVILELRAGARTARQARLLDAEIIRRFDRRGRVFAPSTEALKKAGELLARLAVREGWTTAAHPSLVHDALLAASCRETGVTLITRDRDFDRFRKSLPGWRTVTPWQCRVSPSRSSHPIPKSSITQQSPNRSIDNRQCSRRQRCQSRISVIGVAVVSSTGSRQSALRVICVICVIPSTRFARSGQAAALKNDLCVICVICGPEE